MRGPLGDARATWLTFYRAPFLDRGRPVWAPGPPGGYPPPPAGGAGTADLAPNMVKRSEMPKILAFPPLVAVMLSSST